MSRRVRLATGGRIEEWCSVCGWFKRPSLRHVFAHAVGVADRFTDNFRGPRPPAAPVTAEGALSQVYGLTVISTAGQAEVDAALAHRLTRSPQRMLA
jgi:hypothetical protein